MKRLLVFLGIAALSCGLYAEVYSQATFEPLDSDAALDTALGDDGVATMPSFWYTDSDGFFYEYDESSGSWEKRKIGGTVMLYGSGKAAAKYAYPEDDSMVAGGPGEKYLSLIVENKTFYRTKKYGDGKGYVPEEATKEWDIGDGKIVDALVQFVSANDTGDPDEVLEGHDKIAVWLYADETVTNLYVTAADGSGKSHNFKVDASVAVDSWHRVTVRAIEDIGDGRAGFTVYIDGSIVKADDDDYESAMSALDVDALGPEALELYRSHHLFRSRVGSGHSEARKFLAVGFKGEGNLDDITIADFADRPSFVAAVSAFRLNWTPGISSFKINNEAFAVDSSASGSTNMVLSSGTTTISITDIVYVDDYKGAESYEFNVADGEGTIVATRGNFTIVGKEAAYETLSAAIAAAVDGDTIRMHAPFNIESEIAADDGWIGYTIEGKSVTLDLAGKTLEAVWLDVLFSVNGGLSLCDSVGGGKVVLSPYTGYENGVGLFGGDGENLIKYGDTGQELVCIEGILCVEGAYDGVLKLQGGYFTDERVASTEAWYYDDDDHQAKYISDTDNPLYKVGYYLILLEEKPDEPAEIVLWPGSNGGYETKDAAEKAANNAYIVAPLELGEGLADYQNLFVVSVEKSGDKWAVVVALSDDATAALKDQLNERVKEISLAAIESRSIVYTGSVTPGIYYRAIYGAKVGDISTRGDWELANESGDVTLPLDKPSDEAGFYRLEAEVTTGEVND